MVDLYGHAGLLEKAIIMTQDMPSLNYSIMWYTIFSDCQKSIDINVGRWAYKHAVKLDKSDGFSRKYLINSRWDGRGGSLSHEHEGIS